MRQRRTLPSIRRAKPSATDTFAIMRNFRIFIPAQVAALAALALFVTACSSPAHVLKGEELARFVSAGPITPEFDEERLLESITIPGPYKIVPGDVLLIRAPASMVQSGSLLTSSAPALEPARHFARVSEDGEIDVPVVGTIKARGLTVQQLESAIADGAYPKYLSQRPSIVVTLDQPKTVPVTVFGAVQEPGVHRLASDQLTLSGALSAAGGVVKSGNLVVGARKVLVYRPSHESEPPTTIALPVRGLNVPFYDVELRGGERIEVERYEPDRFTVLGLVARSGAYEYPPEIEYNLMQALAIAGGVDRIADPPYATVFRKDLETNEIIPATFKIKGDGLVAASSLQIKPGDVISLGHTKGSWTRAFIDKVLRLNVGFFADTRSL